MKFVRLSVDAKKEEKAKNLLTQNEITWNQGRFQFDVATFVVTAIITAIFMAIVL